MHARFPAARIVAIPAAALLLTGGLAVASGVTASAATCVPGFPVQPQNPGLFANKLNGAAVFSRCDAWAVGYTNGSRFASLAEHWNGTKWKVFPVPDGGGVVHDNFLYGVGGSSGTNVWAVGEYGGGTSINGFLTLIEHWNGTSWSQVPSKNPGGLSVPNVLNGVAATSGSDAWAVGRFSNGTADQTLIEHWDGTRWRTVPSPDPGGPSQENELLGVTATSRSNAWAVGDYFDGTLSQPLIEHWDGTAWKVAKSPVIDTGFGSFLRAVSASSGSSAWAVGHAINSLSGRDVTLIEHWNGTAWKIVKSPNPGQFAGTDLNGVAATSGSNAWAVGSFSNGSVNQTLIEHWDGTSWKVQPSDDPGGSSSDDELNAIGASSQGNAWSVGFSGGGMTSLALHCC
jgi:hypothetical protein